MTPRFAPIALGTILVLSLLAALAVPVAAQSTPAGGNAPAPSIQLKISALDVPIRPLSGSVPIKVDGKFIAVAGVSVTNVKVSYKVDSAPTWASVTISPSTVFANIIGNPGQTVTVDISTNILVSTTADAPAFQPTEIQITASSEAAGDIGPGTTTERTLISADYFSIVDAQAATTIQIARPQVQVAYPITVINYGNGNTKVLFEIKSKPNDLNWNVQEPFPVILEAKQNGGKNTQQTINLNILTPYHNGYLNQVGAVTMGITSNYALDVKLKGDTTSVTVLTTTKGFYVPGFESVIVITALLGLAVALRRRS